MSKSGEFHNYAPGVKPQDRAAIVADNQLEHFESDPRAFAPLRIDEYPETIYCQALAEIRIQALLAVLRAHDPQTADHVMRTGLYGTQLAYQAGCEDNVILALAEAGLIHDLGKILVSPGILRSLQLEQAMYDFIKHHPKFGHDESRGLFPSRSRVPVLILTHHCYTRHPYTDSPSADQEQAPTDPSERMLGEMLAAADIFDALFSNRAYNAHLSTPERKQRLYHEFSGNSQYLDWLMELYDKQLCQISA